MASGHQLSHMTDTVSEARTCMGSSTAYLALAHASLDLVVLATPLLTAVTW